jgi:hypothetical protein
MGYGYYSGPGAIAGAVSATSANPDKYMKPEGFLGMDWRAIAIAVTIGSLTAVLTQLALESIKDRKASGKGPRHEALILK